jgi:hypothetical protein
VNSAEGTEVTVIPAVLIFAFSKVRWGGGWIFHFRFSGQGEGEKREKNEEEETGL